MGNLLSHKTFDNCFTELPKRFLFSASRRPYDDEEEEEVIVQGLDTGILPADLMREILEKLPSKSLMRFLSVSKAWHSEILSPAFIHKHNFYNQHKYVSFIHCLTNVEKGICLISKKNIDDPHAIETYTKLQLPIGEFDSCSHMEVFVDPLYGTSWRTVSIGCSNGLVCMRMRLFKNNVITKREIPFVLWNPARRQLLDISSPRIEMFYGAPHGYEFFGSVEGFSYVPRTGDYKLVTLVFFKNKQTDKSYLCRALVLNVAKINTWRKVKDQEVPFAYFERGRVVANGCLNLLVSQFPKFRDPSLLIFDFDEEIFRYTSAPYICKLSNSGVTRCWKKLTIYKENLAMFVSPNFRDDDQYNGEEDEELGNSFELWVYDGLTWSNLLGFGPLPIHCYPFRFWRTGELVILKCDYDQAKRKLTVVGRYLYNLSNKIKSDIPCVEGQNCSFLHFNYTENLVNIKL